jgi:DNA polymerase III subunit epsilon
VSWFQRTPLADARWVVLDCETSGLDPKRDRLLSIGALKVRRGRIDLSQTFSSRIRATTPSPRANILIHGIGGDAQLGAPPPEEVLPRFAGFAGEDIAVAYHAWFDREVLRRALAPLGLRAPRHWLDLEPLARDLVPRQRAASFDAWLRAFGIEHAGRHDALLDALAAAEMLLVLLAQAARQGRRYVEQLL